MSIETRYWARTEPKDGALVFFSTGTAAAHSRAEADSNAREISQAEYEQVVPTEARNTDFYPAGRPEKPKQDDEDNAEARRGVEAERNAVSVAQKQQIISEHHATGVQAMMAAHEAIMKTLASYPFTTAEQVFILTMSKQQIVQSMFQPMPVQSGGGIHMPPAKH